MESATNSQEIGTLYKGFSDAFHAGDDEAVRRIYRELLRLGRPRAEIVDTAVRLSAATGVGLATQDRGDLVTKQKSVTPFRDVDLIFRSQSGKKSELLRAVD